MRKLVSLLAAVVVAAAALAPAAADARDRRGYGHYDGRHHRYYRDHDDGDAVAAGVVGLVLGLAIGSMASQPRGPDCYDNYRRCPPRDGYYDRGHDPRYDPRRDPRYEGRYYDERELEGGYDPRYDDPRAGYERDYGRAPQRSYEPYYEEREPECTRRERQWDRYANRYVVVDVPC